MYKCNIATNILCLLTYLANLTGMSNYQINVCRFRSYNLKKGNNIKILIAIICTFIPT